MAVTKVKTPRKKRVQKEFPVQELPVARVQEVKPAIDPTVSLPVPRELVKTAEWVNVEEVLVVAGLERRIPHRYPKINGIIFSENTSPADWRKVLEWFPKEPVILPESDDEREKRQKSGKYRAAELIIWQGVVFTIPKGIPVMVPQPIAEMVAHVNEVYRTKGVMEEMERMAAETATR